MIFSRLGWRIAGMMLAGASLTVISNATADDVKSISQYGITWTFDKSYTAGRFVTGDWWVIGPVTITSVRPTPGPATVAPQTGEIKGRYGVIQFNSDSSMRNGSMIMPDLPDKMRGTEKGQYAMRQYWFPPKDGVPKAVDDTPQGFDSRDARNYMASLSLSFPKELKPGDSICSSISYPKPFQQTYGHEIQLFSDGKSIIQTAAILSVLDKAPPADAFRPPYAGSFKPIFETKNLKWDALPKLATPPTITNARGKAEGAPPDWALMEHLTERPCIDRILGSINENCNTYGREFTRINGIATLMLMLDVPQEHKQKLMISIVQRGIDYYGLMKSGQAWPSDGGINMGRKWIILFAGMMLGENDFLVSPPWAIWQEDTDTYYGTAWDGKPAALWQMTWHTGPNNGLPFEEMTAEKRGKREEFANGYQNTNSDSYPGEALAALLMKARATWNHDAFFDYVDRYMRNDANILYFSPKEHLWTHTPSQGIGSVMGRSYDSFVNAMWKAYREKVPAQPNGKDNRKWVWTDLDMNKGYGTFVDNPKEGRQGSP